jgi:hypothetical protein
MKSKKNHHQQKRETLSIFKKTKLISLILIFCSVTLLAYYEKAHQEIARVALAVLKKDDPESLYEEIYSEKNSAKIIEGSYQEDFGAVGGHDRAFRHYWDPDTNLGCPWFNYFLAMPALEPGSKADPPENPLILGVRETLNSLSRGAFRWHYPGALEWAKKGAGSGDLRNWEGAIRVYNYTPSSRIEAYWRLGHVVHLLADMAEPDHAANVPHAASGFYYPKDLQKIRTIIDRISPNAAQNKTLRIVLNRLRRLLQIKSWSEERTVGFEGFIEDNADKLFPTVPAVQSHKRGAFDTYFSVMASKSKSAVADRANFPLPLGISYLPEKDQSRILMIDDSKKYWSFFPSIHFHDETESEKFLNLARTLLTTALGLEAGLMEFFHDIVDPPPYVRSVMIRQEGKLRYHGWWKDNVEKRTGRHINENKVGEKKWKEKWNFSHEYSCDVVASRELQRDSKSILPDKAASVRIDFGPDPKRFDYPPERIKKAWIKIGDEIIKGRLIDGGTAWEGQFTPRLDEGENERDLQMEIFAQDVHNHKANRITFSSQDEVYGDKEYRLDTEPEYPAKAMAVPPYDWQNYRPGTDLNHVIKVKEEGGQGFSIRIVSVHKDQEDKNLLHGQVWLKIEGDIESLEIVEAESWYEDTRNPKDNQRVRSVKKGDHVETSYEYPHNKFQNRIEQNSSFWSGVSGLTKNGAAMVSSCAVRPETMRHFKFKGLDEKGKLHEVEEVFRYGDWAPDPEHEGLYKRNKKPQ